MLKGVPLRYVIFLVVLLAIIIVGSIFRRFGVGEFALLIGFVVLLIMVEAGLYVARRFLQGLRGRK